MGNTQLCTKKMMSFFKAGNDEHRQRILAVISQYKSLNSNQILQHLKIAQPTLSHHLKILKEAEFITSEKRGKEIFFSLNKANIAECCGDFLKAVKN
jgi:DNA-binding transcriptional ArsR family regulator